MGKFLAIILSATLISGSSLPVHSEVPLPVFSGERALWEIVRQVGMGPRVPGSKGHRIARKYLVETLSRHGASTEVQGFLYVDPLDPAAVYEGFNIIGSFHPGREPRIMLAAHWDTRPWADRDPDPDNRGKPVPGANDGASGVAVLLEMARLIGHRSPDLGVDIILFDLEDMGDDPPLEGGRPFAVGSRYFAASRPAYRPYYGILLDMVCDRNLTIPMETNSRLRATNLVNRIWAAAETVGADSFLPRDGGEVVDDHLPFLDRDIPMAAIIHSPFPPSWHTLGDTPDKCSAESLQQVGDVLVKLLYDE